MISTHNLRINYATRFLANMLFTMPVWIAYYKGFLSEQELSIIVGTQFVLQILLEIPSGAIADLLGRKATIAFGYFIGSLGTFGILFATNFWGFLLLRIAFAIMDAFISGADEALIYDSLKQDKVEGNYKKIYSKTLIAAQFGLVTAAFCGGFFYTLNVHLPWILYGTGLFAAFIISLFYIEPAIDSEKFSWVSYKKQFAMGIKEIFRTPVVSQVTGYFIAVGGITWAGQMFFNTSFLTDLVSNNISRGAIQATIRLVNILLLATIFGKYDKSSTRWKLLFFPLIMLLAYLPGYFIRGYWGIPLVYLATLTSTVRWVYMSEITNRFYDSKYRATAISTMSMLVNLVTVLLLYISGIIIPLGGTGLMYSVMGVLTIFTVYPLYLRVRKNFIEEGS